MKRAIIASLICLILCWGTGPSAAAGPWGLPELSTESRACIDCHTVPPEGQSFPSACEDCHAPDEIEDTEIIKRSDAFHSQCIDCHKDFEAGPQECSLCHMMKK